MREQQLRAWARWLAAAGRAGVVQDVGGKVLIQPEWMGAIGYERQDRGRVTHHLAFQPPEIEWADSLDGFCPCFGGISVRLGVVPSIWLYLPFPEMPAPNDDVSVNGRLLLRAALPAGYNPAGLGLPHFFIVPRT